jgi:hypothetical protein
MPDSRPKAVEHGAALGVDVEIVTKDPQVKGFSMVKRRSIVERTPGWLSSTAGSYVTTKPGPGTPKHDHHRHDR